VKEIIGAKNEKRFGEHSLGFRALLQKFWRFEEI